MITEAEIVERLRKACQDAGSQFAFARRHGFDRSYIHDILHGKRPPADRILAALGLERIVVYREKAQ